MDIQIYTDLEDKNYVLIDLPSLINAYKYAVNVNNHQMANSFLTLFREGKEENRIEKTSSIYHFLQTCPTLKVDEINFEKIKEAYLIARLQNNTAILRSLGKILGHWEQYVLDENELEGLAKEIIALPEQVKFYILKYHNISIYEKKKREEATEVYKTKKAKSPVKIPMNSFVEMGDIEKIYIKDKAA